MTERPLVDVAREAGITYRQADHWCARGYIVATFYKRRRDGSQVVAGRQSGSGKQRRVSEDEARVLRDMARLVAAGIQPDKASELTRNGPPYRLAEGVHLVLEEAL